MIDKRLCRPRRVAIAVDSQRRSLFREVNERIRDVNGGFARLGGTPGWVDVFCECGRTGCLERVRVTSALYEEIRSREGQFLVTPGHERGERVVAEDATYRVVLLGAPEDVERGCRSLQLAPAGVFPEAS